MNRHHPLLLTFLLCTVGGAHAESAAPSSSSRGLEDFAGLALRYEPVFDGSSETDLRLQPLLNFNRTHLFARTTRGLLEAGALSSDVRPLRLGAMAALDAGRRFGDDPALRGLEDEDATLAIGPIAEASYSLGPVPLTWTLRWRQSLDSDRGAQADLRLTAGAYASTRARAAVFAQWTWADAEAMRFDFGIDASRAAATGLPGYAPDRGTRHTGLGAIAAYALSSHWRLVGIAEVRRLGAAARSSPLVADDTLVTAAIGAVRRF